MEGNATHPSTPLTPQLLPADGFPPLCQSKVWPQLPLPRIRSASRDVQSKMSNSPRRKLLDSRTNSQWKDCGAHSLSNAASGQGFRSKGV
uniref:Uncharacterized protein n=1 Tax=Knipowitschia caucasica TaxID=637954 RepID=A0AAV2JS49_KNICA